MHLSVQGMCDAGDAATAYERELKVPGIVLTPAIWVSQYWAGFEGPKGYGVQKGGEHSRAGMSSMPFASTAVSLQQERTGHFLGKWASGGPQGCEEEEAHSSSRAPTHLCSNCLYLIFTQAAFRNDRRQTVLRAFDLRFPG